MQFQENIIELLILNYFEKKKYCLSIFEIIVCDASQTLSDIIYININFRIIYRIHECNFAF